MAGAVGAGGLGKLAINYGYNQFMPDVMLCAVVAIIIIVQVIQMMGDMISRLVVPQRWSTSRHTPRALPASDFMRGTRRI